MRTATAPTPLGTVPPRGRVCVFRALPGIGDLLCASPALRALRTSRPDVSIALVTLPASASLARRYAHLVDEVIEFPGFPGLPDRRPDIRAVPGFLARMQARGFDLAVQLHGTGELTNEIVSFLGARHVAGFHPEGRPCPDPARFLAWVEAEPEVRRWLRVTSMLGCPPAGEHLELPLAADSDDQLAAALADAGAIDDLALTAPIVIHPGASVADRRWPAAAFAEVVTRLAPAGRPIVLTGGERERGIAAAVAALVTTLTPLIDLSGRTSIDALGALVRRAALVVANDTGISHIAAALGTPSVIVFSSTDPARWAPLDAALHRAVRGGSPRHVASLALRLLEEARRNAA